MRDHVRCFGTGVSLTILTTAIAEWFLNSGSQPCFEAFWIRYVHSLLLALGTVTEGAVSGILLYCDVHHAIHEIRIEHSALAGQVANHCVGGADV